MSVLNDIDYLTFTPGFFEKIWGGQKLRSELGMPISPDKPIGEAWLVADHAAHESIVDEGPLAGQTLRTLLEADAPALLGSRARLTVHGRFPLLLKILDAHDVLSVQVHPDDEAAARLGEPDVGKTEMWRVLQADPGSELICGLAPDTTPDQLRAAISEASVEQLMTHIPAEPGTAVFVAAGTVHAIGGGILLAEIQQNSDITYRLYDYDRRDASGQPRELHIEKALSVIRFGSAHRGAARPLTIRQGPNQRTLLAACRYFAAESITVNGLFTRETRGESFHILLPETDGLLLRGKGARLSLVRGRAVLLPGDRVSFEIEGEGNLLDYYVPNLHVDVIAPLNREGFASDAIARLGGDPATSDVRP